MVRLPEGMREKIRQASEANNRTMNSEIVARLEASFALEEPPAKGLGGVFARAAKNSQLNLVYRVDELQLNQRMQMAAQEEMRSEIAALKEALATIKRDNG